MGIKTLFLLSFLAIGFLISSWTTHNLILTILMLIFTVAELVYFIPNRNRFTTELVLLIAPILSFLEQRMTKQFLTYAIVINVLLSFYLGGLSQMKLDEKQKALFYDSLTFYFTNNYSCLYTELKYLNGDFLLSCKRSLFDFNVTNGLNTNYSYVYKVTSNG